MHISPFVKKVGIIALLLLLIPTLLQLSFYLMVFFLCLIPGLWIAAYILRKKMIDNLLNATQKGPYAPFARSEAPRTNGSKKEEIVIDVTAERR